LIRWNLSYFAAARTRFLLLALLLLALAGCTLVGNQLDRETIAGLNAIIAQFSYRFRF
jgi:hypothetical protein